MSVELALTRSLLEDMDPASWERVAAFLEGLIAREPLHSGPAWERERFVLGGLMTDLREAARAAGELEGDPIVIRAPGTARAEQSAHQRAVAGRVEDLRAQAGHEIEDEALAILRAERERFSALRDEIDALNRPAETPSPVQPETELPAWA